MGKEPERRLPGEPDSANEQEDIELWVDVYTELAATLKRVAAGRSDRDDLMQRLIAIESRRQYWLARRKQGVTRGVGT